VNAEWTDEKLKNHDKRIDDIETALMSYFALISVGTDALNGTPTKEEVEATQNIFEEAMTRMRSRWLMRRGK